MENQTLFATQTEDGYVRTHDPGSGGVLTNVTWLVVPPTPLTV